MYTAKSYISASDGIHTYINIGNTLYMISRLKKAVNVIQVICNYSTSNKFTRNSVLLLKDTSL